MKKIPLPYYDSADFTSNVKSSSKFKKENKFIFLIKKIKNYFLGLIAYYAPINNLRVLCHRWRGVNLGNNVYIGMRCTLDHAYPNYIFLKDNVILSGDIYIIAHNKPSVYYRKKIPSFVAPVVINKNVFIGVRSVILPGVEIGEGTFVAASSAVFDNVPKNVVIRGNPAKTIHNL